MTNGNSDRLDRVERLIEAIGQRVDSNAKAIAANSAAIAEVRDTLSEAAGRTLRAVDELREIVEEDRVNFTERLERTDTAIAGINSTLAILQQLLRERNTGD
jgi:chromosome segregation ATPase